MKRLLSVIALAALAAAALAGPGAAGTVEARVQTLEYVGGGLTIGPERSVKVGASDKIGAVAFRGGPERFVSIEIEDAHGLPVTGIVGQADDPGTHICGATDKPLRVRPYEKVTVFLLNGVCGGGVSVATAGTVTATFTRTR